MDPRIPTLYAALDSGAFVISPGAAYDALILDAISQAHNRLQSAGSHGFALFAPTRDVTYGDIDVPSYRVAGGAGWQLLVPDMLWPKKPGAAFATFRAEVGFSSSEEFEFQVVTEAAPFAASPALGAANVVRLTGDGSAWQTLAIDDVPVGAGDMSRAGLWVRTESRGSALADTALGAPNTGVVMGLEYSQQRLYCRHSTATSDIAWNTTLRDRPIDFASRGYGVEVTGPDSEAVVLPILSVHVEPAQGSGLGDFGILTVTGASLTLAQQITARPDSYTFEIRALPYAYLAGFSGAAQEVA